MRLIIRITLVTTNYRYYNNFIFRIEVATAAKMSNEFVNHTYNVHTTCHVSIIKWVLSHYYFFEVASAYYGIFVKLNQKERVYKVRRLEK
jgi:hypothetical protein